MNNPEKLLKIVMIVAGVTCLLAIGAIIMPTEWMAVGHEKMEIKGPMPTGPLTEYLTRSIAGLYAMLGGLMVALAMDVRRFAPIIRYLSCAWVIFGVLLLAVDAWASMPLTWTINEGVWTVIMGAVFLILLAKAEKTWQAEEDKNLPDEPEA